MNRRGFCLNACQIASLVALGSLVEDCSSSPTSPSGSEQIATVTGAVANNAVVVNVGSDSPLAAVGGAALVQSVSGAFLVAHISQDAFNAMTAICTHEGCTINEFGSSLFQCECHGSQFNTSGGVVRGPATQSLKRFNTTFVASVLTIAL